MELDFTEVEFAPMENTFIHLCALIARRVVNPCFPCFACHKNLPWEESSHHTRIVEAGYLRNNSLKKIEELLLHRELFRKYFSDVVAVRSGRRSIFDIVTSCVSGIFGLNPQSSLMYCWLILLRLR